MSKTKEDIKRLQDRAEAGDASAQNDLGCAYHNADGVARDYAKAREWYLKAAEQKNSYAQNNLGQLYLYGSGVPTNTNKALRWYRKSALHGNQYGLLHLAELYEEGKGVEKDIKIAYELYKKAAAKGNKQAKKKVSDLKIVYDENVNIRLITNTLLSENIFRMLGLYVNASSREITAHKAKIRTFLSVGKRVEFETDHLVKCLYPNIYPHQASLFEDSSRKEPEQSFSSMSLSEIYETIRDKETKLHALSQTDIYHKYLWGDLCPDEELTYKERCTLSDIEDLKEQLSDLQHAYDLKRNALIYPKREQKSIETACNEIEDNTQRLKYSFFWFFNTGETDERAFGYIRDNNTEAAYNEWDVTEAYNSLMNVAVLSFLNGDNNTYIRCVTDVIHTEEYRTDFIKAVCGTNNHISEENLAHLFIDTLLSYIPNENWQAIFKDSGVSSDDDEYIESKLICLPINELDNEIKKAKSVHPIDASAYYKNILQFKAAILDCLDDFTDIIRNKDDYRYGMMCDKASDAIISLSQSYYKACSHKEYECTQHCVEFASYAMGIAHGASAVSNAETALEEIKAIYDKIPSREVYDLIVQVKTYIESQKSLAHRQNIPHAKNVVEHCAPIIVEIQEHTSKKDKTYIHTSTEVVEYALSIIISVFNHDFEEFDKLVESKKDKFSTVGNIRFYDAEVSNKLKSIKNMLKDCCALFANLDLFDKDTKYTAQRYDKNKNAILKQSRDFGVNPDTYLPTIDLRNDDDFYNDCTTKAEYESYIKHHPHGKHILEVNSKIEKIRKEEAIEDDFWSECKLHQTYKVYLQHYPQGRYAKAAREAKDRRAEPISTRINVCILFTILSLFFLSFLLFFRGNSDNKTSTSSDNRIESLQNQQKESTGNGMSQPEQDYSDLETDDVANSEYEDGTDEDETEDVTLDEDEDSEYGEEENYENEY